MQLLWNLLSRHCVDEQPLQRIIPLDGAYLLLNDEKWLNFASHDYLGLSHRSELKKNAMRSLLQEGVGLSSTQLVHGYSQKERELEDRLKLFLGKESLLFSSSRKSAEQSALHTLSNSSSLIFIPENYSLSTIPHGVALSRYCDNLKERLELAEPLSLFSKIIIADFPTAFDPEFISLAEAHCAFIYVDVTEVVGMIDLPPISYPAHLIVAGFENGLGCSGACIASSQMVKDYLFKMHTYGCRLPPATIGAIETALDISSQMEGERKQLEQRAFFVKKRVRELGLQLLPSPAHFIHIQTKESSSLKSILKEHCFLAEFHEDRVTFILNVHHTLDHLHQLIDLLDLLHI